MHSATLEAGSNEAPNRVVIIHGYTGSPDEFRDLADVLARRLDAYVTVPLLPGHGTTVEDLARYSLKDLCAATERLISDARNEGKPLALIGHSFGAHFVLLSAAKHPPKAAVLTVMPYHLRPPFSVPGMELYARSKAFWDKPLAEKEKEERKAHFYYKRMPGVALGLLKEANRLVKAVLPALDFPILVISNREDPMSYPEGGEELLESTKGNPRNKSIVLEKKEHGLFYGSGRDEVIADIADFLEKEMKGSA